MKDYLIPVGIVAILGVGAFMYMGAKKRREQQSMQPPPNPKAGGVGGGAPGQQGPLDGIVGMAGQASVALSGILSDRRVQGGIASAAQAGGAALGSAIKGGISSFGGGGF